VWLAEWSRADDTIDWLEETYLSTGERCTPRVDVFPHGIYPFNGAYMDNRTGGRLSNDVMNWIRARSDGVTVHADVMYRFAAAINYASDGQRAFRSPEEADRHIGPIIPIGVAALAHWGELFTGPRHVLELRPMRYLWWS
jgi:hypothetical protein